MYCRQTASLCHLLTYISRYSGSKVFGPFGITKVRNIIFHPGSLSLKEKFIILRVVEDGTGAEAPAESDGIHIFSSYLPSP